MGEYHDNGHAAWYMSIWFLVVVVLIIVGVVLAVTLSRPDVEAAPPQTQVVPGPQGPAGPPGPQGAPGAPAAPAPAEPAPADQGRGGDM